MVPQMAAFADYNFHEILDKGRKGRIFVVYIIIP
jgi:hypothetical protein